MKTIIDPSSSKDSSPVFALLIAATIFSSTNALAAVPSGAAATPEALRQAYIDATKSHNIAAIESLFDMSTMTPDVKTGFREHLSEEFTHKMSTAELKTPDPKLVSGYAEFHAHFTTPVIKTLKINYVAAPGQSDASEYYIGTTAGRYYFITVTRDSK